MRINILLILWLFFCHNFVFLWSNSVSGVYSVPTNSVKFEKQSEYSILPVGWSKKGNAAFIILDKELSIMKLLIVDTISDKILFESDSYSFENRSPGQLWNDNIINFSEELSHRQIIPDENPQYGGPDFSTGGDDFSLYTDQTPMSGNRGIAVLELKIESRMYGTKTLFKYIHDDTAKVSLYEYKVLGYFKSPWEKRIAVLSAGHYISDNDHDSVQLTFSGAHLSIGFTRAVSSETELIDSLLTGQYYISRLWLEKGADPNIKAPTGNALVLMAAMQNNWDLVFLLIEYNADIAVIDKEKKTLLHHAAQSGNMEAVTNLMLKGINKNFRDSKGKTAYELAWENGHKAIAQLLKE